MDVIMHDFKVGDKFQVKEAWLDMTINKDYEVLKVEDGHVTCINDFNEMNDLRIGDVVPFFYKENKYVRADTRNNESRATGGATHYYKLPTNATELKHLIRYKKMSHPIGEAFCSLYRLNDNGEYKRNLEKAKFYIETELEYLNEEGN